MSRDLVKSWSPEEPAPWGAPRANQSPPPSVWGESRSSLPPTPHLQAVLPSLGWGECGISGACFLVIRLSLGHWAPRLLGARSPCCIFCFSALLPALQKTKSRRRGSKVEGASPAGGSSTNWLQDPCHLWASASSSVKWVLSSVSSSSETVILPESAGWPRAWERCPWVGVGRWRWQAADDLSLPLGPVQSLKTGASSGSPGHTAGSIPQETEGSQMPL